MGRKRKGKAGHGSPDRQEEMHEVVHHPNYDIVWEPLEGEGSPETADPYVREQLTELYELTARSPAEAAPILVERIEKYPDVLPFYNYLTVAYARMGDMEEAKTLVKGLYEKRPDYLFAKLNYIDLCVNEGRFDEVPKILGDKYDLHLLQPGRTRFHITEFVGFAGTVGNYFARIGKIDLAEMFYDVLQELAPDDPQTVRLERALKMGRLSERLKKLSASITRN